MVKQGKPKPVRFAAGDERDIKIYAIEKGKTFSAAVRELCRRGLAAARGESSPPPAPSAHRHVRRVLSRGVGA